MRNLEEELCKNVSIHLMQYVSGGINVYVSNNVLHIVIYSINSGRYNYISPYALKEYAEGKSSKDIARETLKEYKADILKSEFRKKF